MPDAAHGGSQGFNTPGPSPVEMTDEPRPDSRSPEADKVETRVRARIDPDPEMLARLAETRADLVRAVQRQAQELKLPLSRALVAGSAARGTFLKDRLDVDLFLLFPPELSKEELAQAGLSIAQRILKNPERRYADHPYLRGTFEGFTVDAVPGYAITDPSQPKSPVDRTPFHDEYLRAHQTPTAIADVRLTKQFLLALGVYGSEARTQGFSGYLVELLLIHFHQFRTLLEAARHWRIPVRLRPATEDPPRLPEEVALILADPVDPHRNVASALARRNLALFILAADAYLRDPAERWFKVASPAVWSREEGLKRVEARGTQVLVVELPRPSLVDDTLFPQLRKAERAIAEEIERSGFEVVGSSSASGERNLVVLVEVEAERLPSVRKQDGPPVGLDRVNPFLAKWTQPKAPVLQGPYVDEEGRMVVETRRGERDLVPIVKEILPRLSLGKNLSSSQLAPAHVRLLREQIDSPELGRALVDLLGKQLPWRPH